MTYSARIVTEIEVDANSLTEAKEISIKKLKSFGGSLFPKPSKPYKK